MMETNAPGSAAVRPSSAARSNPGFALSRRRFLARTGQITLLATGGLHAVGGRARPESKSSLAEAFDREMDEFVAARNIPGGALAVVKDQRLVYARGYGWADREKQLRAQPDSLFRIASISKPFTAVAVLRLVQAGKMELDAPAFDILSLKPLSDDRRPDARLKQITIRQLLHHTGGWDRDKSGDPMFRSKEIARSAGVSPPARQEAIIRYMLGRQLDFDPGSRYVYSNFGYCVLGRVIEKISGLPYGVFVREQVLTPAHIRRMKLGSSLETGRAEGEVKYYDPNDSSGATVFSDESKNVPTPYGSFCLEAMDSHGGWLASAVDLARFAAAMDEPDRSGLLKADTCRLLYEPPAEPVSRRRDGTLESAYYACGWQVRPVGTRGKANYWHNGSLPGTSTLLVRRADGLAWAALFNQRSRNSKLPDGAIDSALHRAANALTEWPTENMFERYG